MIRFYSGNRHTTKGKVIQPFPLPSCQLDSWRIFSVICNEDTIKEGNKAYIFHHAVEYLKKQNAPLNITAVFKNFPSCKQNVIH